MYYVPPSSWKLLGFLPPDASNRLTCVVSAAKYVVVHHQGATLIANLTRKLSAYRQGNHEILFSSWCLRAVRNHSPGLCKDLHHLIPIADLFLHTTPDPLSWKVRWPGNSGMGGKHLFYEDDIILITGWYDPDIYHIKYISDDSYDDMSLNYWCYIMSKWSIHTSLTVGLSVYIRDIIGNDVSISFLLQYCFRSRSYILMWDCGFSNSFIMTAVVLCRNTEQIMAPTSKSENGGVG